MGVTACLGSSEQQGVAMEMWGCVGDEAQYSAACRFVRQVSLRPEAPPHLNLPKARNPRRSEVRLQDSSSSVLAHVMRVSGVGHRVIWCILRCVKRVVHRVICDVVRRVIRCDVTRRVIRCDVTRRVST